MFLRGVGCIGIKFWLAKLMDKNFVSISRTFTSNVVRRSPQRAGWAEGGIRKLTEETTTNVPYKVLNQILSHVSDDLLIGKFH